MADAGSWCFSREIDACSWRGYARTTPENASTGRPLFTHDQRGNGSNAASIGVRAGWFPDVSSATSLKPPVSSPIDGAAGSHRLRKDVSKLRLTVTEQLTRDVADVDDNSDQISRRVELLEEEVRKLRSWQLETPPTR